MKTQMSPAAGNPAETNGSGFTEARRAPARHSLVLDVVIALVAGFLYTLLVMGPKPLNPRNVNWIAFDPAYHYIGWEPYRQDPHLHWPLTYTDRLGYPEGESVALLDVNPLM